MRQYTTAPVDLTGIGQVKDKLIVVAGEDSGDGPDLGPILSIAAVLKKGVERFLLDMWGVYGPPRGIYKEYCRAGAELINI